MITEPTIGSTSETPGPTPPTSHVVALARGRVIDAKLGGYQVLAGALPDTADEAQLNAAADKLAESLNIKATAVKPSIDPATMNPHDRMLHAVGQQSISHGNRLATSDARAIAHVTSETLGDVSGLSAYERLDRVVHAQEKQLGR